MSLHRYSVIAVMTLSLAVSGCGGPVEEKIAVPSASIVESVRKTLEIYEKTGMLGSGISSLEADILTIKNSNRQKGEALLKICSELKLLTARDDIKKKATEMIAKL